MFRIRGFLFALISLSSFAASADPIEGIEYRSIAPNLVETGAKIEVREFFWYGCSHCYTFEPHLERWLAKLPKNVQFVRMPAVFKDPWPIHARTYYTFLAMGILDKMHRPFFDAMHLDRLPLSDPESIADFVKKQGVDRAAFLNAYNSFSVETKTARAKFAMQTYGIESVPTIVVDGKYLTSPQMAGGHDLVLSVVDYLVGKAAAERAARRK
ncbi:MAG: thiol:disulfide interchange protein DsbA/DsbL [Gammaproteobacteria bacterium]|nr:thiol:disulfide interchange protein DsbA/DsbL [Gammaproteobacteria bacterium]